MALAALTLLDQSTGYPLLGAALLVVGVGAGFSFTVTADVILSSVSKEHAGSASAVSETAYELGAALGIAVLGSIVTGVYRDFAAPAGTPEGARESLGGAVEAASGLPTNTAQDLLSSAREAFVDGLTIAAGAERRSCSRGGSGLVHAEGPTARQGFLGARAVSGCGSAAPTRPSPWWRTCPRTPARTTA